MESRYKLPPQEVVEILDAPPAPMALFSPRREAILFIEYRPHPSIEFLAQPFLRLAGLRIHPERHSRQRLTQYTRLSVRWIPQGRTVDLDLPADARVGIPDWSYDGKRLAFTRDLPEGVELWVGDAVTGEARAIPGIQLNDILVSPLKWMSDSAHLLVCLVLSGRGRAPEAPRVPSGPIVEETSGKISRVWTYQDLLKDPHDEDLFEYFATSRLALVNADTGEVRPIGAPGMIAGARFSPDENALLVTRLRRPFSYRVPYYYFTRTTEVWDRDGNPVTQISDLPVSDEIPTQGVPTGPRNVRWIPLHPARLLWTEALDGGDPLRKVPHRDRLMGLSAPFTEAPAEILKIQHRFSSLDWTARRDQVLLTEYDRDRRWRTTSFLDLTRPEETRKVTFDLSANDAYHDPGRPVYETRPNGETVLLQDGDCIYLNARGASETGEHPTLDRLNLDTLDRQRLFQSRENACESFISFVGDGREAFIIRSESQTEPPNYFLMDRGSRTALTSFEDPAPQLTGLKKELMRYDRADGVALSGTFYLPPGYQAGEKLPLLIWAYPLEYSDPGTAGQVRGSPHTFTFLRGASPLFFLTQGYAVLMDATMPVVGDPETMNDTFIEQVVGSARAAIDRLDALDVIDRNRVCVGGHSYGAFMTANLLAHSDAFAAGIGRSGAYNRSLTPFGFQSERRSFWEAPGIYAKVSPFTYADRIKRPLLLIHGEADNNAGTHPMQSKRFYQAIKGNGGTARLVLLPHESHGYVARESVLHTLAEMFEWANIYVKHKKD